MMNGVAYQLLWSLLRVWKATIFDVLEGPTRLQPRGLTVVLEPPEGGDLEIPGAVEQIKARSTGGSWSLEEVIQDVLPDLYKACRARETPMRYRFVTEGSMGQWKDVYEFFRSLGTRAIRESDPLASLDDQRVLASAPRNHALARRVKDAAGGYTERGIFLYIARVLAGETGEGKEKSRKGFQDPPDVLHRNLLRLLGSFEFQGGQQSSAVEDEVLRELSARGAKRLEKTLDSLIAGLLRRAREGGAVVERESLLAEYGLQAISLDSWDLISRESRLFLQRTLKLHGYRASEDCRERRPLLNLLQAENGQPIVAWGESGQGKSWLVYGTAEELARRDEVVLLLDSTQDVLRDRDEAARLFCERIWGTDERYSLDRLAQRVRQQVPERAGRPWLTVLIDGVRDRHYLAALVQQEWEAIGIRVAVALTTGTTELPVQESGMFPLSVRDFSHSEVLRYLRLRLGQGVLLPPRDILRLLRHPLWAKLSCDLVDRGGQWQSANEYQVIEGYWTGQAAHAPMATDALTELASRLVVGEGEGEIYPWPLSQLRAMGLGEIELDRLVQTHLVRWTHGRRMLELWHERLLHWCIAEGLVSARRARRITSEELRSRVRACIEGEGGRRFGYVPMDVLWLIADPAAPCEEDVLGMLQLFEEIDGLFTQISTTGGRIVPYIFARLRQIARESSSLEIRYLKMLESMEEPSIAGFAVEMLNETDVQLQKIAARILATHGSPQALDRLWALYREWSVKEKTQEEVGVIQESEVDFHDVVQVDQALASCVSSSPDWLEQTIRAADSATDPVHTLVYLIPKVEHGRELWQRIKHVALKRRPIHERSLAVCIAFFLDRDEVPWLMERVNSPEDSLAPVARKGLYLLSPEGAFQQIDPEAEFELALARSWWLPPLQIEYPQETARLLLETIRAAEKPWHAASLYGGREDWMSEEILELLLDATNEILARELAERNPENSDPLWRPFSKLRTISHPDLLKLFWKRRGTDLEQNLTTWLIREGPTDGRGSRLTPEAGLSLLRKIAGDGIFQVANSYLETATTHWGRDDAYDLAMRASNERTIELLVQVGFQDQEHPISSGTYPLDQRDALAVLAGWGCYEIVVSGIVRWGMKLADFDEYLGAHRLSDDELAPALDSLALRPVPSGAILALGMSGRPEMEETILSLLSEMEPQSEQALACLLSLEMLDARSEAAEEVFRRALEVPNHQFVARRFLTRIEARRATDESRVEAARRVWEKRQDPWSLHNEGESLEILSSLDNEEVKEYLREEALSEASWGGEPSAHFGAVQALVKLDPGAAFEAARHQIARGSKKHRRLYPKLLLDIDKMRAEEELANLLRKEADLVLLAAIGEALDRTSNRELLLRWLGDPDPRLRQGACLAAEAMRWSQSLDDALFALRRDEDWDTREAAWQALEAVRLQKEVDRLVVAFRTETDRARRWSLLDAVLDLGYPGVVGGYGRFGWFLTLQETEGLSSSVLKYAIGQLKKHREKLVKELEERERD
jgi:hypothetical protein